MQTCNIFNEKQSGLSAGATFLMLYLCDVGRKGKYFLRVHTLFKVGSPSAAAADLRLKLQFAVPSLQD